MVMKGAFMASLDVICINKCLVSRGKFNKIKNNLSQSTDKIVMVFYLSNGTSVSFIFR